MEKTNSVIEERRKKIERLREMGVNPYPSGYRFDIQAKEAFELFGDEDPEALEKDNKTYSMAAIMALSVRYLSLCPAFTAMIFTRPLPHTPIALSAIAPTIPAQCVP